MDKRFIPVAMLAGALALAGCGGGSSTTAPGSEPPNCGDDEMLVGGECVAKMVEEEEEEDDGDGYVTVDATLVPGGYDLLDEDEDDKGQIRSGGTGQWSGRDGTRLEVTCNDDDGCLWRVRNGQLQVIGDFEAERIDPPAAPKVGGASATSGETNLNWLSPDALVNAVKPNRTVELVRGNVRHPVDDDADLTNVPAQWTAPLPAVNDGTGTRVILDLTIDETESPTSDVTEGLDTTVRLIHTRDRAATNLVTPDGDRDDDYLVFGTWETDARSGLNPNGYPKADVMWSGSIPYTQRLRFSTGTARYTGHALGHYKSSVGSNPGAKAGWTAWDGNVRLDADFATDQVSGFVYTNGIAASVTGGAGAPSLDVINLGQTGIGENVDGTAKIAGSTDATGSWQANFYGTRAIQGQPTGVAGGFKSERPWVAIVTDEDGYVSGQSGAVIQGAFGAHNTGVIPPQQ